VALWLGDGGLVVEYGGDALSRYDVSFSPGNPRLENVTNPRLFATRYRSPQLKLFALDEALGEGGWLKALGLEGYAARSRKAPDALQEVLFPYLGCSLGGRPRSLGPSLAREQPCAHAHLV
jgi:hypothetical protein